MPQLIAMIIVVVGAMIYMFQTFGGTGDKIEGIAQKTSIVTEINNIRNGLQLAVRAGDITNDGTTVTTLRDLAQLGYFADQMNVEISNNTTAGNANQGTNAYSAISFGGEVNPGLIINLVTSSTAPTVGNPTATPPVAGTITQRPGIRVQLVGELASNAPFLESQLANDLAAIASIDRTTTNSNPVTLDENGDVPAANRATAQGGTAATNLDDGIFTIYFKDMPANVVQN
ncbi:hypothetical protein [Arcobacter cloacae]|uniref:Uncharacterized protein n=1 Tax=Arcobacter cloacae TaxID=1054034 RepID=A0A4Q0ZGU9_9BACT|nr:hypothetical protein [Arcobacter cloacae]RXJ85090.1 hypothetical protein CRU90_03800 [Arcobacter cloacae]